MKLAWILGTALSLAATSGCAPADEAPAPQEALGSASFAVSAIGPDGHRYRLWDGTTFAATTPDGNPAFNTQLINGAEERQTIDFEVGSYLARLENAPGPGNGQMFLVRETLDGSSLTIVAARLVSPDPLPFTIRAGQTTQLTFRFSVPELGDVVFSAGEVDVGIDVDSDQEPSQGSMFYVNSSMTVSDVFADVAAVPGLQQFVDGVAVGDAPATMLGLTRTSDWRLLPEGFCADVQIGSDGGAIAEPEVSSLLVQALNGTGSLCFMRASAGGLMLINVGREGEKTFYNPDFGLPDPISIRIEGYGTPSETLVEGGVLHLSKLDEPFTVNSAGLTITVNSGATNLVTLVQTGTITINTQP
jgi:hypothetical protein